MISVMLDEHREDTHMTMKQKPKRKQPARRVVFSPDRPPPGKKMSVTVRDPLSRRVVKRS